MRVLPGKSRRLNRRSSTTLSAARPLPVCYGGEETVMRVPYCRALLDNVGVASASVCCMPASAGITGERLVGMMEATV